MRVAVPARLTGPATRHGATPEGGAAPSAPAPSATCLRKPPRNAAELEARKLEALTERTVAIEEAMSETVDWIQTLAERLEALEAKVGRK